MNTTEPDYAYKTVEEYESIVGFKVNQAFRMAWNLARITNQQLGITQESEETNENKQES
jgi:hypothetical protein